MTAGHASRWNVAVNWRKSGIGNQSEIDKLIGSCRPVDLDSADLGEIEIDPYREVLSAVLLSDAVAQSDCFQSAVGKPQASARHR